MDKKILFSIGGGLLLLGLLGFIATVANKPELPSNKLLVTASFYPLYFFSEQIAGDKAIVINITPAGAEPHEYEPTAQDIANIYEAKLLILNGVGLEPWGDNMKQNIDPNKTKIVEVSEGVANNQYENKEGGITQDPHIWLNPLLAKEIAVKIATGFIQADPENKNFYEFNLDALKEKLDALDEEYRQGLKTCQQKNIVTSHNAFEYLASAYGLRQVPISGISTEEEPSAQDLVQVAKFVKDNKVEYIFFETLVSPKLAETIANEVGVQTLVLNPIEGLTKEEIGKGKNYFTEMQNNLKNLQIALQCKP
ncbi:MAG: hypothetical protein A3A98_02690 [Candidatus Staskawiczbacteria bacterium RIFCSPLOWO2_01_FULL_40_39]|uniref:ABC transporter substrate-binding protein n=1 Tax=Candidatus Staskawiczbacteria bacterium RIFCSPHIGHO2_01_FULL_39_25 TaxID=1802202 RepID=A0A1G2HNZ6_9BACT|nr:MAG: hypothetical protein A2730_02415 [Candidatus Staskawiczbacteria bacterium RIFCSPHIGHO2_01_FULL_39_25]OGZ73655.1 MAG: hypothetical protein A3A98_02690 [Candidatus Staskawiczbacteria bacterium RIFCSPLOWO2_01_FULL_40_39]